MRIRFETTLEDVIAFHRFHYAHSPVWRRQVWTQILVVPGILAVAILVFGLNADDAWDERGPNLGYLASIGIYVLIFSALWGVFIQWRMNANLVSNARKLLAEGSNRTMFGWREMELVNGRLVLSTELIESSLDLRAIEKIVTDGNYTYVYIASVSAYMIPMNLFPEDEYRAFVAELREAWENRDAPRPIEEKPERAGPTDMRIAEKPL